MTEKGYKVLKGIVGHGLSQAIDCIIVGRDKNVLKDYAAEIHGLAKESGIKTFERTANFEVNTKYAIAISWRWLISFENKRTQLITFHDSILPRYRGFAPLVNQLLNKEQTIGVTAIFANKEFDRGDIIAIEKREISYPIKIAAAISLISEAYHQLMLKVIGHIQSEKPIAATAQKEEQASYSLWRDDEDYQIKWEQNAAEIKTFIDAVGFPYAGACTTMKKSKVRIFDAEIIDDVKIENRDPGKILFIQDDYPVVVCGRGLLKITDAVYDKNRQSLFPLKKFRIRFT